MSPGSKWPNRLKKGYLGVLQEVVFNFDLINQVLCDRTRV